MAKYEIMLVVDGSIDKDKAKESIAELEKLIDRTKNFECQELGHKTLAYKINNKDKGWYFQYNFENEIPSIIADFRRLALINRSVLRHLVINLEKDYGYKSLNNPKKIKRSEHKLKKFNEYKEKIKNLKLAQANEEEQVIPKKEVEHNE